MLIYLNMLALLVHLTTTTIVCGVRRGGKSKWELKENQAEFQEKVKNILGKNSLKRGTFFSKENVKMNSWHVTSRWWRSNVILQHLKVDFVQSDVDKLCLRMKAYCTNFDEMEFEQLPTIEPFSWKSCAVVAYGSNLLFRPRGSEIDEFNTVIRLGMVPITDFEHEAGRKNTFVYIRDRKLRTTGGDFIDIDKNGFRATNLLPAQSPEGIIYASYRKNGTGGWPTISFGGDLSLAVERSIQEILRLLSTTQNPPDPTSGLVLTMIALFSGNCKSVGVFGISSSMGPRYWEASKRKRNGKRMVRVLKSNHNTRLEVFLIKMLSNISEAINGIPLILYE